MGLAESEPEAKSLVFTGRRAAIGLNMRMQSPDSPQSKSIGIPFFPSNLPENSPANSLNKGEPRMDIHSLCRSTTAPKLRATPRADKASAQSELARMQLWPSARTAQAIAR